jgi:hypothetical protein
MFIYTIYFIQKELTFKNKKIKDLFTGVIFSKDLKEYNNLDIGKKEIEPVNSGNKESSINHLNKLQNIKHIYINYLSINDSSDVKKCLEAIIKAFNEKEKTNYYILSIGKLPPIQYNTLQPIIFNCFITDYKTGVTLSLNITLAPSGTNILEIKSNYTTEEENNMYLTPINQENPNVYTPFPTGNKDTLITKESKEAHLLRMQNTDISKEFSCFGIENTQNIYTEFACKELGGFWDSPASKNEDCPYYLSNKNYTNTFGGTKFGYCQNPSGLLSLGYKGVDQDKSKSNALCYNCDNNLIGQGTLGYCCDNQKNNKNFITPDYKFDGDLIEREKNKETLAELNLSFF